MNQHTCTSHGVPSIPSTKCMKIEKNVTNAYFGILICEATKVSSLEK